MVIPVYKILVYIRGPFFYTGSANHLTVARKTIVFTGYTSEYSGEEGGKVKMEV